MIQDNMNEFAQTHLNLITEQINELETDETRSLDVIGSLLQSHQELSELDLNTIDMKAMSPKLEAMNQRVRELCENHIFDQSAEEKQLLKSAETLQSHIHDSIRGEYKTIIEGLNAITEIDMEVLPDESMRNDLLDNLDWALNAFDQGFLTQEEYKNLKGAVNQALNRFSPYHLSELPDELLLLIFSSQLSLSDLNRMKLVSKRFLGTVRDAIGKNEYFQNDKAKQKLINQMVLSEPARKTLWDFLSVWSTKAPKELSPQAQAILSNVRSLPIDFREITLDQFMRIKESCPNLTSLDIVVPHGTNQKEKDFCTHVFDEIGKMGRLKDLSLSNSELNEGQVKALSNLRQLESLSLERCTIYDQNIFNLLQNKHLKTLSIIDSNFYLENQGTPIQSDELLKDLSESKNIKDLTLRFQTSNLTNEGLKHLSKMENLEKVNLFVMGHKINEEGVKQLGRFERNPDTDIMEAPISPGYAVDIVIYPKKSES